jgi:MFS transporter, DHA1 family, multidrug resistance protein
VARPLPFAVIATLGGLIALSALAIDITIVALPATTTAVGGDPARSGLIVTAYLVGFAPGQLLWGLLGDRLGRRVAVLAGLVGFIGATVACALAGTFQTLLLARVGQGLAGGSGPVLARAIVRDLSDDTSAARMLALFTAILGTAPLVAPVLGAALLALVDWRSVFWFTALYGALLLAAATLRLPESRPPRAAGSAVTTARPTRVLLASREFRIGAALVALPFGGYHAVLALYPVVSIVHFGVGETAFTVLLAIAAACFVAGSAASRTLVTKLGLPALMRTAGVLCLSGAVLASGIAFGGGLGWLAAGACLYLFGVGQMLPLATALALRHAHNFAAWAAALLGVAQIGTGAFVSWAASVAARPTVSLPTALLVSAASACVVLASAHLDAPMQERQR